MSKYDVVKAENFSIVEISPETQQNIQGGGKVKAIKAAAKAIIGIASAGFAAAIAGYKAVKAAID